MASNSQRLIIRVLIGLGLIGAGVYFALDYFRPEALVAPVITGEAIKAVSGTVSVRAESPVELKSESPGKVIESHLELGKLVKKDDVLVKLDSRDVELEIEKIESDFTLFKQRIELTDQKTELDDKTDEEAFQDVERKHKAGQTSEAEFVRDQRDRAKKKLDRQDTKNAQQNQKESYENQLKVHGRSKDKMTIRAPFDGQIADFYVWPGQLIGNGTVVAKLISLSRTVEAKISEEKSAGVKVGQKATVTFLPYGIFQFNAKVTKILPTSDPETQRRIVHLDVEIEPEKLRPGINRIASRFLTAEEAGDAHEPVLHRAGRGSVRRHPGHDQRLRAVLHQDHPGHQRRHPHRGQDPGHHPRAGGSSGSNFYIAMQTGGKKYIEGIEEPKLLIDALKRSRMCRRSRRCCTARRHPQFLQERSVQVFGINARRPPAGVRSGQPDCAGQPR
jgi:multidrug efflux pump subunit AcrA (membrane-fusion protein)